MFIYYLPLKECSKGECKTENCIFEKNLGLVWPYKIKNNDTNFPGQKLILGQDLARNRKSEIFIFQPWRVKKVVYNGVLKSLAHLTDQHLYICLPTMF